MKPIVVIGFLGTQLDAGQGAGRWEKWRPSVSLTQHEDMVIARMELIHTLRHKALAQRVQADIATEMATVAMKSTPAGAAAATIEVRLAFTAPTALALDAVVQTEIVVEERPNVLIVPGGAVLRPEDGPPFVWVATENSQATKREVRVGLSSNGQTQILSGVAAGDQVIVTGLSQLSEGAAISISR